MLDLQTFLFKLIMKTQAPKVMEEPKDENPISKLWFQLATKKIAISSFFCFHEAYSISHCLNHWQCWKWEKVFHIDFHEVQTSKLVGRTYKHFIWCFFKIFSLTTFSMYFEHGWLCSYKSQLFFIVFIITCVLGLHFDICFW
jgi:hypothetical protein